MSSSCLGTQTGFSATSMQSNAGAWERENSIYNKSYIDLTRSIRHKLIKIERKRDITINNTSQRCALCGGTLSPSIVQCIFPGFLHSCEGSRLLKSSICIQTQWSWHEQKEKQHNPNNKSKQNKELIFLTVKCIEKTLKSNIMLFNNTRQGYTLLSTLKPAGYLFMGAQNAI